MLGFFPVPGLIRVGQGPTAIAVCADGGCLVSIISLFFETETSRAFEKRQDQSGC